MGDFTLGSSVTATGLFDLASGSSVIINGANADTATVRGDVKIQGDSVTTFTGLTVEGALDFDTAGTYVLSNCTINEVTNSSGGAVTIQVDGSIINTNTGPNITLVSPDVVFTVEVNQTGADVVILQAGTDTVLASVDQQPGTTFEYVYSGTQLVDVGVIKPGFKISYSYGISLTGQNSTLPVTLLFDPAYQ
jgi:hypothetical protein